MARNTATWAEFRNPRRGTRVRRRGETVTSVAEFIESITENRGLPWHQVVYRGQKDIRWSPSIFRRGDKLLRYEHEMGRELMSLHRKRCPVRALTAASYVMLESSERDVIAKADRVS